MTEAEIAWVAGLFEGEGCITPRWIERGTNGGRRRARPILVVAMTDRDVVEKLQSLVGGGSISTVDRRPIGHKPIHVWSLAALKSVDLMEQLYPWLGERRRARWDELTAEAAADRARWLAERAWRKKGYVEGERRRALLRTLVV